MEPIWRYRAISIWSLLNSMIALFFMCATYRFYWFIIPFFVQSVFSAALVWKAGSSEALRKKALILFGSLPITWAFAMIQWPGGDDGFGIAWCISLGLSSFAGLAFLIFGIWSLILLTIICFGLYLGDWYGLIIAFIAFLLAYGIIKYMTLASKSEDR